MLAFSMVQCTCTPGRGDWPGGKSCLLMDARVKMLTLGSRSTDTDASSRLHEKAVEQVGLFPTILLLGTWATDWMLYFSQQSS